MTAKVEYSSNVLFYYDGRPRPADSEWDGVSHVRYTADPADTQVQWGGCADPRGALTPGEVYELEKVRIHSWHTKVFLKDVDSKQGFNSVSFEAVEQ